MPQPTPCDGSRQPPVPTSIRRRGDAGQRWYVGLCRVCGHLVELAGDPEQPDTMRAVAHVVNEPPRPPRRTTTAIRGRS